jgi:hypothetical protein
MSAYSFIAKLYVMKQEHLIFLHDTLKYLGFGVDTPLNFALENQIKQGQPSFELETETCYDEESLMTARLYFTRGKDLHKERYFFNKYEACLHFPEKPENDRKHVFYIENNRRGVTFKQAYNLLQGRYVQKRIIDQNKDEHIWWVHLERVGDDGSLYLRYIKRQFDVQKALERYPIKELQFAEARERLCRSLRRGNLQPVFFVHEGSKVEPKLLFANPEKGWICNVPVEIGSPEKPANDFQINELPEFEHAEDEAISEDILEKEPARSRKKAHL